MFHHDRARTLHEVRVAGRRLGRHVEHDKRSRDYPAARATVPIGPIRHRRISRILDQGNLGSCTGNAIAGLLGTEPFYKPWPYHPTMNEAEALKLYERGTQLDAFPGAYPPDDTGSTGLAVAKAAKEAGLIGSYAHAFGVEHALGALMLAPAIAGFQWYDSFDEPVGGRVIALAAGAVVRGGHEVELVGIVDRGPDRFVEAVNSWGRAWGHKGHFLIPLDLFERLLDEEGDVTTVSL